MNIKITSLLRIRNEELIIKDALENLSEFSDEIIIWDDCSLDETVQICEKFPKVKMVLRNYFHNSTDQSFVQTAQRNALLNYARVYSKNNWFAYFDGDERIEFDFSKLEDYHKQNFRAVFIRLVDGYLTPQYKEPYVKGKLINLKRMWGVEFREIAFLFHKDYVDYNIIIPGCRQPQINGKTIIDDSGYVLHFSKCLSTEKWEEDCLYYMKSMSMLAKKWEDRLGKAIHDGKSDFNTDLISKDEIIKRLKNKGEGLIKI